MAASPLSGKERMTMTGIALGVGAALFLAALLIDFLASGAFRYRLPLVLLLLVTGLGLIVFTLARKF